MGVWSGLLRTAALTQVNAAYTPTTQPLSAATGSGVNEASIDVASFQVLYPSSIGLVSYNSGVITPLLDSTYYYVYCLDPEYAGGAQTYLATTDNPTITSNEALVFMGAITTPAHGGGGTTGGGGGGGPCFSENTLIITKDGIKHFRDVIGMHDHILTQKGWRLVRNVICHLGYTGAMCDMDNDELVTPAHRFWWKHGWVRAEHLFIGLPKIERFTGPVYNPKSTATAPTTSSATPRQTDGSPTTLGRLSDAPIRDYQSSRTCRRNSGRDRALLRRS